MTTKHKIILGFVCMIAIMTAISILGYRSLDASLDGFTEYSKSARMNVRFSDAMADLNLAAMHINVFLTKHSAESRKAFNEALNNQKKM